MCAPIEQLSSRKVFASSFLNRIGLVIKHELELSSSTSSIVTIAVPKQGDLPSTPLMESFVRFSLLY